MSAFFDSQCRNQHRPHFIKPVSFHTVSTKAAYNYSDARTLYEARWQSLNSERLTLCKTSARTDKLSFGRWVLRSIYKSTKTKKRTFTHSVVVTIICPYFLFTRSSVVADKRSNLRIVRKLPKLANCCITDICVAFMQSGTSHWDLQVLFAL